MAPSKADKKKKDKKGDGGASQSDNNHNSANKNLCCVPKDTIGCISPEIVDWSTVTRVICNSGKCNQSGYMHAECFTKYEDALVNFMSKQGRGRTWNDKQRYGNMWSTKGYDIIFKKCNCDCGHGYLRKDLDFVPAPPPNNNEAGAVGGAQAVPDKKKKKDKANLKPKLNFNPHSVTGSYFGSKRQKEDEEEFQLRKLQKQNLERNRSISVSSDHSEVSSSTIPGLVIPLPVPIPVNSTRARRKSVSQSPLTPETPESPEEEGWVKISTTRRGSQSSQGISSSRPETPSLAPGLDLIEKLEEKEEEKEKVVSPPVAQLPMFNAQTVEKPNSVSSVRYQSESETSNKLSSAGTGAKPKLSPALPSSLTLQTLISQEDDCIYHSDEDIPFGEEQTGDQAKVVGLSPIGTPNWSDFESTTSNQDREMDAIYEQTKSFEKDLLSGREDGQVRDSNGFYDCRSCTTVHHNQEEYRQHCQTTKHMESVRWDGKVGPSLEMPDLSSGWETMGMSGIWQSKGNSEEYKKELEKVKEELAEEQKQKSELAKEISNLKESLDVELKAKKEMDKFIETLKKESVASAVKERTSWEKQIKDSQTEVRDLSNIMNLLNKELKDLREEQHKVRAEAVQETEAKNRKVINEMEDKLEAAFSKDSLAYEVVASEMEDLKEKNRDLEDDLNTTKARLQEEIQKRTKAEMDLEESQRRLDAMWLSVSEMEAEAVRLKTSQTREEAARMVYQEAKLRLEDLKDPEPVGSCSVWVSGLSSATQVSDLTAAFSEHGTVVTCNLLPSHKNHTDTGFGHVTMANSKEAAACVERLHQSELAGERISVELSETGATKVNSPEKTFLRKLKLNVEEGEDEEENKARDNPLVKNVLTEFFDEVLQQKRNHPVSPRQELTNILQDSIKDPALRNCLTSIISPAENADYDSLDREPHPGHDSEIDSYLGEDLPGEFDDFFGEEKEIDPVPCSKPLEVKVEEEEEEKLVLANNMAKMTMPELTAYMAEIASCDDVKFAMEDDQPLLKVKEEDENSIASNNSTQNDASSILSDSPEPDTKEEEEEEGESDSYTTGDEGEGGKEGEANMNMASLERLVSNLALQVSSLNSKVEDYSFENGLLARTVDLQQSKTTKMSEVIEELQQKNTFLEKSLSQLAKESQVTELKESFMEILDSCENFQESFNSMEEKQGQMEERLDNLEENIKTASLDSPELREDLAKIGDKLSSLNLEFQVEKGQSKVQMDNLAYNLAVLESKIPSESFSSTSGVKSGEPSDTEELTTESKETGSSNSSSSESGWVGKVPVTISKKLQTFPPASSAFLLAEGSLTGQPRIPPALMPRLPSQPQYIQFLPTQTPTYLPYPQGLFYR